MAEYNNDSISGAGVSKSKPISLANQLELMKAQGTEAFLNSIMQNPTNASTTNISNSNCLMPQAPSVQQLQQQQQPIKRPGRYVSSIAASANTVNNLVAKQPSNVATTTLLATNACKSDTNYTQQQLHLESVPEESTVIKANMISSCNILNIASSGGCGLVHETLTANNAVTVSASTQPRPPLGRKKSGSQYLLAEDIA